MVFKAGNRQTYRNIFVNLSAFVVQFLVSFFVSPLIVREVGADSYGFINLANDFVSYSTIITSIFNSVSARFISNAIYEKDYEKANGIFNSLIVVNIGISLLLGISGGIFIPNIARFLIIPEVLIEDVQITFALVFLSYIVTLMTLVFTTSTFVTNRMDLEGIRNIISQLVKVIVLVIFLYFFKIKIYWVAFASLISGLFFSMINIGLTKKLTPELTINITSAKKEYALLLASAGGWMAFTQMSNILTRGLDLIIANRFIGNYEMGLLSIARAIPNQITNAMGTIIPIFTPVFMWLYANRNEQELIEKVKASVRIMACLFFVPLVGFTVYSYEFYELWQSSLLPEELRMVAMLSNITVLQIFFNLTTGTLSQLSLVTNRLKLPVIINFGCGIINIILVFILLKLTKLGVLAIVLSSTGIWMIRYIFFNCFYAAYVLNQKWYTFIFSLIRIWCGIPILFIIFFILKKYFMVSTWIELILAAFFMGTVGYVTMFLLYGRKIIRIRESLKL